MILSKRHFLKQCVTFRFAQKPFWDYKYIYVISIKTFLYTMRIFSVHYVYTSFSQMHELPQILKTGRGHCFHDYICVRSIWLLCDLSTLSVGNDLWPLKLVLVTKNMFGTYYLINLCIYSSNPYKNQTSQSEMDVKIYPSIKFTAPHPSHVYLLPNRTKFWERLCYI